MGEIKEGVDVVVIGAGPGGYVAAIRAAQLGRTVTLIDALPRLGGVCLNWGCIPSKALIHVAGVYQGLDEAIDFGISVQGKSLDWSKTQEWKEELVKKLSQGVEFLCKENGVEIITGTARFTEARSILVESDESIRTLEFKKAIIATGARPVELPMLPFDEEKGVVSAKGLLSLTDLPQRLAVIGAGYIGVELGTAFAKLGSQVTIIELQKRILPEIDPELAKPVAKRLKSLGVDVRVGTQASSLSKGQLHLEGQTGSIEVDKVLMAVGNVPNSAELQLDQCGVQTDERGAISINQQCQTSQPDIYAIGDVVGGMMLAHKASAEGKVAAEALCGQESHFDNFVPSVIFSDPEISSVGLSEAEAGQQGIEVDIGQFPLAALGRALASHATDGFVKVIADAKTKRLLGFQMVGSHVSELIATATQALEMGALTDDLLPIVQTHPTFSEAIGEAIEAIYSQAIHLSPRKQKRK